MITYTKQGDGTYLKAGAFATEPKEVRIQIGETKPFSGSYTLAQATLIIEDAITKKQVAKDVYKILPPEVPVVKAVKEPKVKTPKAEKAPKVPKPPKEPKVKTPRVVKYDVQKFAAIYAVNKSLDEVCAQTGASKAYAHRALVKLGLYEKPVKAVKAEVVLTEDEVTRVNAIQTEQNVDRVAAIKVLRKEQRAANRPVKTPKGPRVLKYSLEQFASVYKETGSADAVVAATGASKVYAIRALTKLGLYVKPVKVVAPVVAAPAVAAEVPVEAPAVAAPKRARKSKPNQEVPAVETTPVAA